ncbi:hypothetical protein A3194_12275 [Candidatus Thiodiazotropha endoloripes]|uniref:hypothetical protein n=1 Tax=Candidatus Thiodiazotropha endoloripes TaxID=1818881 RepID=UPI00083D20D6|nr:hypothetical protein [Candidatus Thiodiazotropha endoloripes]ODB85606.1 hypothetical protein A3194_12275 [Candidatus Thiodiazotropha endoloripes]
MDELDYYFMRVSAIHHELSLIADRLGWLAKYGRGNDSNTAFVQLENRRKALNSKLQEIQSLIESK